MLTTVLDQLTGQLERRFLINAFFPVLVASMAGVLVVVIGNGGVDDGLTLWRRQDGAVQIAVIVGLVAVDFVVANVLSNGILGITRLFEGYRAGKTLASWGRNYHFHRLHQIVDNDAKHIRYPQARTADQLAPTALGNYLAAAERYPADRYGVQGVRLWGRLYHLLPGDLRDSMNAARESMEFFLIMSLLSGIFAVAAGTYLLFQPVTAAQFFLPLLGGALLCVVSYATALLPARVFGDHVRTAYDMHRLTLFDAMGWPRPASIEEERVQWRLLVGFLDEGAPDVIHRWVPSAGASE